jgi:hypothetical protein
MPDPAAAPPEADPATDLASLIGQAQSAGNVTWSGNAQVIDARNVPGLRAQMVETLKQYGIQMADVPAPGAPGAAGAPATPAAPAPADDEDPVQKLEKLSVLHKQGVLTDAEFQSAKAKALGEL